MSVPGLDVVRHIPVTPQGRGKAPSGVCRRGGWLEDRAIDSPRCPVIFPNVVCFLLVGPKEKKGREEEVRRDGSGKLSVAS